MAGTTPKTTTLAGQLGAKLGRDSLIYFGGTIFAFPAGLVLAIVLTRFLSRSAYGDYAVLIVGAGLITQVLNVGTLQGAVSRMFAGGDEGALADDGPLTGDPRLAATTGVVVTALLSVVALGLAWLFAHSLAQLLLHDDARAAPIRWMAVAGGLGA